MRRIDLRREDGVAMTEFALVLPVFVLIIVGILSFGRVFFYWIEANHLANETARWAVVDRNPYPTSLIEAAAKGGDAGTTKEFSTTARVCLELPDSTSATDKPAIGDRVVVKVQKPFGLTIKMPFFDPIDMKITLQGSSTMRIERRTWCASLSNLLASTAAGTSVGASLIASVTLARDRSRSTFSSSRARAVRSTPRCRR